MTLFKTLIEFYHHLFYFRVKHTSWYCHWTAKTTWNPPWNLNAPKLAPINIPNRMCTWILNSGLKSLSPNPRGTPFSYPASGTKSRGYGGSQPLDVNPPYTIPRGTHTHGVPISQGPLNKPNPIDTYRPQPTPFFQPSLASTSRAPSGPHPCTNPTAPFSPTAPFTLWI